MDQQIAAVRRFIALPSASKKRFWQQLQDEGIDFRLFPIPAASPQDGAPSPSMAQARHWFLWRLAPDSALYHIPGALELEGELDAHALATAFDGLCRRHAQLRTNFVDVDGQLQVRLKAQSDFRLQHVDLSMLPPAQREQALSEAMQRHASQPFDLGHDSLLRASLVRLAPRRHALLLCLHHIIADGWSLQVLMEELVQLYRHGDQALAPLPLAYSDYAVWQRAWLDAGEGERQLAYWRDALGDDHSLLALPHDRPRPPEPSQRGGAVHRRVPGTLASALHAMARAQGATGFMVLLAAFQLLLYRHGGQSRVRVGVPLANRNRSDIEGLVGCFTNTQVLQAKLAGDMGFDALLAQVRTAMIQAQSHQDLPFEQLVEALQPQRSLSHHPLFQALFSYQKQDLGHWNDLPGLSVRKLERAIHVAKFDLDLLVVEDRQGGMEVLWTYATDLFDAATIERMADQWLLLLEGIVADPSARLDALPLLDRAQREALLQAWNPQLVTHPEQPCLHTLIEAQAAQRPDALAVDQLSYGELNRRANRLAHRLRKLGVGPERLVGIAMERGPELIVSLLAVLKAGGAYLPLDPVYPGQRLAYMIDDARPVLILSQQAVQLPTTATPVVVLESLDLDQEDPHDPRNRSAPGNLAYCIYTSGSTGQPKGALLSHRQVTRLFQSCQGHYRFGPNDTWTLFHSYAFDFSVWEIFGALLHGGRLVVVPHLVSRSPQDFHRLLVEQGVTVLNQTPSAFRQLMPAALASGDLGRLRLVIFGGEALAPASLAPWFEAFGERQPQLVNMYGITETTVHVTYWPLVQADSQSTASPIGHALDDLSWYVLDAALAPAPIGVPGELYIGGAGLARGYLNRPGLTAERFIPNPFGAGRLYRTGDQARWRADGSMDYLGRNDRQVKLRGFRIELGEIEARLKAQAGVVDAVVLVHQGASGEQLVAYLVAPDGCEREGLRAALATQLPDYMLPAHYMVLAQLPLTANGKLDRQRLPAPEVVQGSYRAPSGAVEVALAAIWQEVLGIERVGAEDNFFELGGHSLVATQVLARIAARLGVRLPLRSIFEAPVLQALAARIVPDAPVAGIVAGRAPLNRASLSRAPLNRAPLNRAPLSPLQRRLHFMWQMEPDSHAYHVTRRFAIAGRLQRAPLEQAAQALAMRQAVLRTRFAQDDGEPCQEISASAEVSLQWREMADEAQALAWLEQQARQPFDLAQGRSWRLDIADLPQGRQLLQLSLHHIVADALSVQLLVQELAALYRGQDLPPLPIQYADYAAWQQQWLAAGEGQQQLRYWTQALLGAPPETTLPLDHPRSRRISHRGARLGRSLPVSLAKGMRKLAGASGVTPFMAHLAAFQYLLARATGQCDISVGVPMTNRAHLETEGLIGCFLNTQVLRAQIDGLASFTQLLAQVRETVLQAQANQDLPFEQVVEALQPERSLNRHPLFQIAFDYRPADAAATFTMDGLALQEQARADISAKFDLELSLLERADGSLTASFTYAADLFDAATVSRLADYWERLLAAMVADPAARLESLPMLSAAELAQLERCNATAMAYPRTRCVHQLLAQHDPGATALVMGGQRMSYGELEQRANGLAARLQAIGVGPDVLVGVAMQRSLVMVVSLVAIWKAGGAYLPLDPAYPAQRLADMVADARPLVVLTQTDVDLPLMASELLCIDELPSPVATPVVSTVSPANLAYCIYTSGSTGKPKGVMVSHANLVNFLQTMTQAPGLTRHDRVLGLTSLSFDIAGLETWLPLMQGAQLVLTHREQAQDPRLLMACIVEHDISVIQATPSTWRMLSEQPGLQQLAGRTLLCGGEALPADLAHTLLATGAVLWNVYGPTETTIWSARRHLSASSPQPLLGEPIGNTQLHVLDAALQPCAPNVVGELYIGGDGVARGYRDRRGLTAERFVPDPFGAPGTRMYRTGDLVKRQVDGAIDYVGRIDDQVKLRGFRIELGEIEACLLADAAVRQAVVVLRQGRLVAYLVAGATLEREALMARLARQLPDYMLPSQLVLLDQLPLTANGKIDRQRLPEVELEQPSYVAPATATEIALAGIWQEVLGVSRVGAQDSFFRLGGHSLLAVRCIALVRERLLVDLPLRLFFESGSLAALARHIAAGQGSAVATVASLDALLHQFEPSAADSG